jgi:hypothetical protein
MVPIRDFGGEEIFTEENLNGPFIGVLKRMAGIGGG